MSCGSLVRRCHKIRRKAQNLLAYTLHRPHLRQEDLKLKRRGRLSQNSPVRPGCEGFLRRIGTGPKRAMIFAHSCPSRSHPAETPPGPSSQQDRADSRKGDRARQERSGWPWWAGSLSPGLPAVGPPVAPRAHGRQPLSGRTPP